MLGAGREEMEYWSNGVLEKQKKGLKQSSGASKKTKKIRDIEKTGIIQFFLIFYLLPWIMSPMS